MIPTAPKTAGIRIPASKITLGSDPDPGTIPGPAGPLDEASTRPRHVGVDGVAPAPEPKLAVACSGWEEKVPSATVVGLARWAPRTARCPRSLLPTRRSSLCSSCPGFPAGNGHCQVVGLWRCLFPPSQANGCAICEIVATVLASKRLCRIAWLQSGDAGCIAGAVSICSRSGTLAIPLWSPVKMRRRLQSPQPRSPQRERDWAVEPAKLPSYGSTGSLLPPTDLASAGHEDQERGWG